MNNRGSVDGDAYSSATRNPATASSTRSGPLNAATSPIAPTVFAIPHVRNPDIAHSAAAASASAIHRHTGVSRISNVTSHCGSFFSNGVSATN